MGTGKKLKQALYNYLTYEAGAVIRNAPSTKVRKYKNVEITQDFKRIDNERKARRLEALNHHKNLLEKRMSMESKLLESGDKVYAEKQIEKLHDLIAQQEKQITAVFEQIESYDPEYMVVEGLKKMSVINHIHYLQYLNTHHPGFVLHPETIKAIENVYYCVNHNLPVNRIKLYEMMPQYFETEIGQLEEAQQRLIYEKKIYDTNEDSQIQHFQRDKIMMYEQEGQSTPEFVKLQGQLTYHNFCNYVYQKLEEHAELLKKVQRGQTPFRNSKHLYYVLLSDLKIKLLPEEEQLKKTILQIEQLKKQWREYEKQLKDKLHKIQYSEKKPFQFIKNHPVLMQHWEKMNQQIKNPIPIQQTTILPLGKKEDIEFPIKLQERIRKVIKEKFDPIFVQKMNQDRSLIDKKQMQIDFYNQSSRILEELEQIAEKSPEQEIFEKLPKKQHQRKKKRLHSNYITRMISLNNQNKQKYTAKFFSKWFDIDEAEIQTLLKHISYIKITSNEENQKQPLKYEILKYQS